MPHTTEHDFVTVYRLERERGMNWMCSSYAQMWCTFKLLENTLIDTHNLTRHHHACCFQPCRPFSAHENIIRSSNALYAHGINGVRCTKPLDRWPTAKLMIAERSARARKCAFYSNSLPKLCVIFMGVFSHFEWSIWPCAKCPKAQRAVCTFSNRMNMLLSI